MVQCYSKNQRTKIHSALAQLVGASSHRLRGCGFDSWSGHMPRLQVRFLVVEPMKGN